MPKDFLVKNQETKPSYYKAGEFTQGGPNAQCPTVGPVDLGLFAWEGFDTEEDVGGFWAEDAKVALDNGDPSRIAHPPQFGEKLDGGKVRIFFDSLGQVRFERVKLGGTDHHDAGRRGLFECKSATDGFRIHVEFASNVCPGKFVHFKKTTNGGPEIGVHERYST
jgi:hypothetical protein